jgi:DNA-binding transcriptional ArsR family regulator
MAILRGAGLVERRRSRTWVFYRIADATKHDDDVSTVVALLKKRYLNAAGMRGAHQAVREECGPNA